MAHSKRKAAESDLRARENAAMDNSATTAGDALKTPLRAPDGNLSGGRDRLKQFTYRMRQEDHDRLEALFASRGLGMSSGVRTVLLEYLRKH